MTLATERNEITAIADGVQTIYPYDFKTLEATDLFVFVGGISVGDSEYTVQGVGDPAGGTITFNVAPLINLPVQITRQVLLQQQVDYTPYDPFPAETHEEALDRLTMITQQLNTDIENGLAVVNYLGAWVTATVYKLNDQIQYPDISTGTYYICRIEHTSDVFATDLANGFWELYIDFSEINADADRASAAAIAAEASEDAALVSETNSAASAAAALVSEGAAAASQSAALSSQTAAATSRDAAYNWASAPEDVPVDDGVNPPGFSAFNWAEKAEEIIAAGGVVAIRITIVNSTGVFIDDLNATDFTGNQFADPANPTQLLIGLENTCVAGYDNGAYSFAGPRPTNVGLGAAASPLSDWYLVTTQFASGVTYVPGAGIPVANNVQDALTELGAAIPLAVPIGSVLPSYVAAAPPGFAFELGETLGDTGSGADFADPKYEEAFDIFNQVLPNVGDKIWANGDVVVLPTAPTTERRVMASGKSGDTLGATGGAEDVTLSIAQLPAHDHGGAVSNEGGHTHRISSRYNTQNPTGTGSAVEGSNGSGGQIFTDGDGNHDHDISPQGSGDAVNKEQPYVVTRNIIKIAHS